MRIYAKQKADISLDLLEARFKFSVLYRNNTKDIKKKNGISQLLENKGDWQIRKRCIFVYTRVNKVLYTQIMSCYKCFRCFLFRFFFFPGIAVFIQHPDLILHLEQPTGATRLNHCAFFCCKVCSGLWWKFFGNCTQEVTVAFFCSVMTGCRSLVTIFNSYHHHVSRGGDWKCTNLPSRR